MITEEKLARAFNAANEVGALVRYWKADRSGPPSGVATTRTEARLLGGHTAVVWLDGVSGCVALSHIEVVQ